jgi:hypothetical protein
MTRTERKWHLRIWLALALLLVVGFSLALLARMGGGSAVAPGGGAP